MDQNNSQPDLSTESGLELATERLVSCAMPLYVSMLNAT